MASVKRPAREGVRSGAKSAKRAKLWKEPRAELRARRKTVFDDIAAEYSPPEIGSDPEEEPDTDGGSLDESEIGRVSKVPIKRTVPNKVVPTKPAGGEGGFLNGEGLAFISQISGLTNTLGLSSREFHAKQKALAQERKAAKPNAKLITRSKKLWERLRIKSAVPLEERKKLVAELFEIITGRVMEFVFKHDSVRVIQAALKHSTPEQTMKIAKELQGGYRSLVESKYGKFLVAKLVMAGDEIRDMIVSEFYGHVQHLIRHPEASWIMDDIYRTVAAPKQKACLLREWYGPEFVVFKSADEEEPTSDLSKILEEHPEKRKPIMQHLRELTNQLVQKKTTGFTMLHDALLQYFLNCQPGSAEAAEFLEMLRDDEAGDCIKNLAFTKSGSRLTCLALAYGNSKDRRIFLRFFKGVVKMLARDEHGHRVLLAAYEVIDDTVMTSKVIFPELLNKDMEPEKQQMDLVDQINHERARIPLLYLLHPAQPSSVLPDDDVKIINEIREIRSTTSKKDPETRRKELVKAMSEPLFELVRDQVKNIATSGFGCYFITEVMFGALGGKTPALEAIADWAAAKSGKFVIPQDGRMLKSLVQGGRYNKERKLVVPVDPPLNFDIILYEKLKGNLLPWAAGPESFVIVAMLESPTFSGSECLLAALKRHRAELDKACEKRNAGARILVQKLDGARA